MAYVLFPLYGPCFPAPMPLLTLFLPRLMPYSVSVKIFQRSTYKGLFKSHELLNDVSLLPWSKNNISPIPTPIPLGWHHFPKTNSCSCTIIIFLNFIPLGKCENAYIISVSSKALAKGLASKQEIRCKKKKNCELEKRKDQQLVSSLRKSDQGNPFWIIHVIRCLLLIISSRQLPSRIHFIWWFIRDLYISVTTIPKRHSH